MVSIFGLFLLIYSNNQSDHETTRCLSSSDTWDPYFTNFSVLEFEVGDIPLEQALTHPETLLILDYRNTLHSKILSYELSTVLDKIPIVQGEYSSAKSDSQYVLSASNEIQGNAISALIKHYNWRKLIIFVEAKSDYLEIFEQLKANIPKNEFKIYFLSTDTSLEVVALLTSRVSRSSGLFHFLTITGSDLASKIDFALSSQGLLRANSLALYSSRACAGAKEIGSLCITQAETEFADSACSYEALLVISALKVVDEFLVSEEVHTKRILAKRLLEEAWPSRKVGNGFSLVNILSEGKTIIGQYTDALVIDTPPLFTGNTTEIPQWVLPSIKVWFNSGSFDTYAGNVPVNAESFHGAHLALTHTNSNDELLTNYKLTAIDLSCGAAFFNEDFARNCYNKHFDDEGVALFVSVFSGVSIETSLMFQRDGIELPLVAGPNASPLLSSRIDHPFYTRVSSSDSYNAAAAAWYLKILQITEVAVVYGDEPWGTGYYESFRDQATLNGIEIVNPEKYRKFHPAYTHDMYEEYADHFQALIDSKARYVLALNFIPYLYYIAETFYDLGMREGDLILYLPTVLSEDDVLHEDPEIQKKREAMFRGAFGLIPISWKGEFATGIYNELQEIYQEDPFIFTCYHYDALALFAEALDFSLSKGENIRDPYLLHDRIRTSRVKGCTGTVNIESETNDRWFVALNVCSFMKIDGRWKREVIGIYSPASAIVLELLMDAIYPDGTEEGTTVPPPTIRTDDDECSITDPSVEFNSGSWKLSVTVILCILVLAFLLTLFCLRTLIRTKYSEIKEKQKAFLNDSLVFIYMAVEHLQLIGLVPQASNFSWHFESICRVVNLEALTHVFGVELVYWLRVKLFMSLSLGLIIIRFCAIAVQYRFAQIRIIKAIIGYLLPLTILCGHVFLIPIVSNHLGLMVCSYGSGATVEDSFMDKDCSVSCWEQNHLQFTVVAGVVLILYIAIEICWRLHWQNREPTVNILVQPKHWYVKTCVQVIIIGIAVVFDLYSEVIQAIVVFCGSLLLCVLQLWLPSMNYRRARYWSITFSVLTSIALANGLILNISTVDKLWVIIPFGVAGGGVFVLSVIIIRTKTEGLVEKVKDKNLTPFIQFQFSKKCPEDFGILAKTIDFVKNSSTQYII